MTGGLARLAVEDGEDLDSRGELDEFPCPGEGRRLDEDYSGSPAIVVVDADKDTTGGERGRD